MDLIVSCMLLLVLAFCYILYKTYFNYSYWKKRNVPYLKPVPFFGNISRVALSKDQLGFNLIDLYKAIEGSFGGIYVFNQPFLILKDPSLVRHVLVKDFDHFRDRSIFNGKNVDPLVQNYMFFSQGNQWKTIRTKTSPVFTTGKLKNMSPLIQRVTDEMIDHLTRGAETNRPEDLKELSARFSMDALSNCSFGADAGCLRDKNADFFAVGRRIFNFNFINAWRLTAYWTLPFLVRLFGITFQDGYVNRYIREALGSSIYDREKHGYKRQDLIDQLVEFKKCGEIEGVKFEEEDVLMGQVGQFFTAGHETISTTMQFAFYELALHPNIQSKLRQEVIEAWAKHGKLDYEAVHKLPYLEQVIKETLRKYPILPFLDRRCVKKYQIPDSDVVIEPGVGVYIPLLAFHYDKKYFPDPQKFEPDRFSEENKDNIPNSVFLPFGDGPRVCLGERFAMIVAKIGLAKTIAAFEIERCKETEFPPKFFHLGITLSSSTPLYVKFKKYEHAPIA